MLNSLQKSEKVSSSSKKRRQLLRQLWLTKLRKRTSSASLANLLYLLGWSCSIFFLLSMLLGAILLSNTLMVATTLCICGICVTLGYWKVLSSRKKRRWLLRELLRFKKWTSKASLAKWLSLLIFCLTTVLPISMLLQVILSFNVLTAMKICMFGALGCWAVAFMSEVVYLVVAYSRSPLRKTFIPIVGAITMISLLASQLLSNLITRVDPAHFPKALIIFTVILTPITWLALAIAILPLIYMSHIALLLFSPVLLPLRKILLAGRNHWSYRFFLNKPKIIHRNLSFWEWTNRFACWTGRAGGAGALAIALILLSGSILSQYQAPISQMITTVLVYSNYQPNSDECKNYSTGEWVAFIGNNKISVAKPEKSGGYTFQTRYCN